MANEKNEEKIKLAEKEKFENICRVSGRGDFLFLERRVYEFM